MAGFNISLSLNEGKVAPTKSTTKAYVSFCFSLSAVVSLALYRFLYRHLVSMLPGYYSLKVKVFPINVKHTLLQLVVRGVNLKIVGFLWP